MILEQKLSVICVSYFSEHLLAPLVENIHQVISSDTEIIIVNNAYPEQEISFHQDGISVINAQKNMGYGGAVNLGIEHSKHQNLLVLNPDVTLLKFSFNFLRNDKKFITGGFRPNDPYGYRFPTLYSDLLGYIFPPARSFIRKKIKCSAEFETSVDWVAGNLFVTNKDTMSVLGGFDESFFLFYEEVDLCRRAIEKGIGVYISPEIKYCETNGKSSSTDVNMIKIGHEVDSFIKYHRRYAGEMRGVILILKPVFRIYSYLFSALAWIFSSTRLRGISKNFRIRLRFLMRS